MVTIDYSYAFLDIIFEACISKNELLAVPTFSSIDTFLHDKYCECRITLKLYEQILTILSIFAYNKSMINDPKLNLKIHEYVSLSALWNANIQPFSRLT